MVWPRYDKVGVSISEVGKCDFTFCKIDAEMFRVISPMYSMLGARIGKQQQTTSKFFLNCKIYLSDLTELNNNSPDRPARF